MDSSKENKQTSESLNNTSVESKTNDAVRRDDNSGLMKDSQVKIMVESNVGNTKQKTMSQKKTVTTTSNNVQKGRMATPVIVNSRIYSLSWDATTQLYAFIRDVVYKFDYKTMRSVKPTDEKFQRDIILSIFAGTQLTTPSNKYFDLCMNRLSTHRTVSIWIDEINDDEYSLGAQVNTYNTTNNTLYTAHATSTLTQYVSLFDGTAVTGQLLSGMRTDIPNYSANTAISLAKALGGREAHKIHGNYSLPLLKLWLYYYMFVGAYSLNATSYVLDMYFPRLTATGRDVVNFWWNWSSAGVNQLPPVEAYTCTIQDYAKIVSGTLRVPQGFQPENAQYIPIRSEWMADRQTNCWWTLAFLQYPYRISGHRYNKMTWNGAAYPTEPDLVFSNAALVDIPGSINNVVFVVIDKHRAGDDWAIDFDGGTTVDSTNNNIAIANHNSHNISQALTNAFDDNQNSSVNEAINRWYEVFRCAESERDALMSFAAMIFRMPYQKTWTNDKAYDGMTQYNYLVSAGVNDALEDVYNDQTNPAPPGGGYVGDDNIAGQADTNCFGARGWYVDGAVDNPPGNVGNIGDYTQLQGMCVASMFWMPEDVKVMQPNYSEVVRMAMVKSRELFAWHDLMMETAGISGLFYAIEGQRMNFNARNVAAIWANILQRVSIRPVYTNNTTAQAFGGAVFGNDAETINSPHVYGARRIHNIEAAVAVGLEGLHLWDHKQYTITLKIYENEGFNGRIVWNNNTGYFTPDSMKQFRNMCSSMYNQILNISTKHGFQIYDFHRGFMSMPEIMYNLYSIVNHDEDLDRLVDGSLPYFVPIVNVIPVRSLRTGKEYAGFATGSQLAKIGYGRMGTLGDSHSYTMPNAFITEVEAIHDSYVDEYAITSSDF